MINHVPNTRTAILSVALRLFLQKGYKDVSYQDIVKKTGLSKGGIYHYFKSKEDLLANVFEFLLEATKQPIIEDPENRVKDYESFRKLFIDTKTAQFNSFKEVMKTRSLKFNKILFFLEAINENDRLKLKIGEVMEKEMEFLKKCFLGLKKHNKLPRDKDPSLLGESLFWMLQGTEMLMFFVKENNMSIDFIKMYNKTIENFFKII
jgi:AcrR family transcriptional regulator